MLSGRSAMKGGAFKLNMAPKTLFDANPYATDKPLPPLKKMVVEKKDVKPFRPSHPAKSVSRLIKSFSVS